MAVGQEPTAQGPTWRRRLVEQLKTLVYRTPLLAELSAPRFRYGLQVSQLCAIANALSATAGSEGSVVEIGVARGMTTVFLNTYLDELKDRRRYLAIDTFSGFTPEDVEHEVAHRGKPRKAYFGFTYNDASVFRRNMAHLGFGRVEVLPLDVNRLRPEQLGAVSVALLDVDLYRPTLHALEVAYEMLEPGGYIFVDDVSAGNVYDGADQAFAEFTNRLGLPALRVGEKCGVIRKTPDPGR